MHTMSHSNKTELAETGLDCICQSNNITKIPFVLMCVCMFVYPFNHEKATTKKH